jgi:hypothetical protein
VREVDMIGRGSNKHRQRNNYNKKFDLILKAFGVDKVSNAVLKYCADSFVKALKTNLRYIPKDRRGIIITRNLD